MKLFYSLLVIALLHFANLGQQALYAQTSDCDVFDNIVQWENNRASSYGRVGMGQSFTANCNGPIAQVSMSIQYMVREGGSSAQFWLIEGTPDQDPDLWNVLDAFIVWIPEVRPNTHPEGYEQIMIPDQSIHLNEGATYTVMLTNLGRIMQVYAQTGNPYSGGVMVEQINGGEEYYFVPDRDMKFKINYVLDDPPQLTCNNHTLYLDENGEAVLSPNQIGSWSDDNPGTTVNLSKRDFNCDDIGVNEVYLTIADSSGQIAGCLTPPEVTVIDNIPPSVTCPPATITANTDLGKCTATGILTLPVATDNCSIASIVAQVEGSTIDPDTYGFNIGTTTVTWTVEDVGGNTVTCQQTVEVVDNESPNILCYADNQSVLLEPNGYAIYDILDLIRGYSDNCGITNTYLNIMDYNGATTANSNTDVLFGIFSSYYDVYSFEAPMTTQYKFTFDGTITGIDSDIAVYVWDDMPQANSGYYSARPEYVGHTIRNANGSRASSTDEFYDLVGGQTYYFYVAAGRPGDFVNYNGKILMKTSAIRFDCNDVGTQQQIEWVVEDSNENTASCTSTLNILDNEAPIITSCAASISVNVDPLQCIASDVDLGTPPDATDPCGIASVVPQVAGVEIDPGNYVFALGDTTVTWLVTDNSGRTNTCEQVVSVIDNIAPEITCPEDIEVTVFGCVATVNYDDIQFSDSCSGASITQTAGLSSGSNFPLGETLNTFAVTDASGNTSTCSFTVTVLTDSTPILACQDTSVTLDVIGFASIPLSQMVVEASGACGNPVTTSLGVMNFSGETTVNSETDVLFGSHPNYYDLYTFVVPVTAQYEFVFSGTTQYLGDDEDPENPREGISIYVWNDEPVEDSDYFTNRPEYFGHTNRNDDGTLNMDNPGTQLFDFVAGETYYFYVSTYYSRSLISYDGKLLIRDTDIDFNCNPGTYSFEFIIEDFSGNTDSCTTTVEVLPPTTTTCSCTSQPVNYTYCYGEYESNTTFSYTANYGDQVSMFFHSGRVEQCCDNASIYDGVDNTGTLLWNSAVDGIEFDNLLFQSTSGSLALVINSDSSISCQWPSPQAVVFDYDVYCASSALVSPKVYLQGASLNPNIGEESLMRDDLRIDGVLPTISPYADGLIADASMLATTGVNAIVDWVLVELRDGTDSSVILESSSALLQRDGDVVGVDGLSPLAFNQTPGDYYVVVNHRNHIPLRSANTINITSTNTVVDFTQSTDFTNQGASVLIDLGDGRLAMVSGDLDGNGIVEGADKTNTDFVSNVGSSGYSLLDLNMNTTIGGDDLNTFYGNVGKSDQSTSKRRQNKNQSKYLIYNDKKY